MANETLTSNERVPEDLCEACAHPDRHHFDGTIWSKR